MSEFLLILIVCVTVYFQCWHDVIVCVCQAPINNFLIEASFVQSSLLHAKNLIIMLHLLGKFHALIILGMHSLDPDFKPSNSTKEMEQE
jgi:hypothetical protein